MLCGIRYDKTTTVSYEIYNASVTDKTEYRIWQRERRCIKYVILKNMCNVSEETILVCIAKIK